MKRVLVIPLRMPAGALAHYVIRCGNCGVEWVQADTVGFSIRPDGALSTASALLCPKCGWRVVLMDGIVTPIPALWCPSCGFRLEDPPRYGWSLCRTCSWEGRTSETLTEPMPPEVPIA